MLAEMLFCLAINIYHEARGEPLIGQEAVAHVTINRVNSPLFPNDVCSVVYQGGPKPKHRCQFSWYCDGRSDAITNEKAWNEATAAALRVFEGLPDHTGGALWYHADYVHPYWADVYCETMKVGYHIFYKEVCVGAK